MKNDPLIKVYNELNLLIDMGGEGSPVERKEKRDKKIEYFDKRRK